MAGKFEERIEARIGAMESTMMVERARGAAPHGDAEDYE